MALEDHETRANSTQSNPPGVGGRPRRRQLLGALLLIAIVVLAGAYWEYARRDLIVYYNFPHTFTRRSGDFTANLTGAERWGVRHLDYRLNGGAWHPLHHWGNRLPAPLFNIELSPDTLREGANEVELKADAIARPDREYHFNFTYDPTPIQLPVVLDWSSGDLQADDGHWERFLDHGSWRVRPVPGSENFDRILIALGAFEGNRRISTDIVFHGSKGDPFGFGVLAVWGGRPDSTGLRPRRGWRYTICWYYSKYDGVGIQFSNTNMFEKQGEHWLRLYESKNVEPETRYRVLVECRWIPDGGHSNERHLHQRIKWWADGEEEPSRWIELEDTAKIMPPGEYGVALMAHRSRVDFGPVTVEPIADGSDASVPSP